MDAEFISERFVDYEPPKQEKYLLKYFTTDMEREFLRYFLIFRSTKRFVQHTGTYCTRRWLERLRKRLVVIEAALLDAKERLDLETVATIESGQFKLPDVAPRHRKQQPQDYIPA